MKTYSIDASKDYDELVKDYKRLAKVADQRLVRLEQYASQENYKNIKQWSYSKAMKDIQKWSGDEAKRFNTAPPAREDSLIAKMNDIVNFLNAPTSTKSNVDTILQKKADTFNEKYGTDLTWEDLGKYYDSAAHDKASSKLGSDTEAKAIAVIKKMGLKEVEKIQKASEDHQYVDDDNLNQAIDTLLKGNKVRLRKIFK